MRIKRTTDSFKAEIYNIVGDEYTLLSEFLGVDVKVSMRHNKCNRDFLITPYKFINRHQRCSHCFKSVLKTTKEYSDEVKMRFPEYELISDYYGNKVKAKYRHNTCGHEFMALPHNFNKGELCPNCKGSRISKSKTKTTSMIKAAIYELVGDEYTLLSEYVNFKTKIRLRHNKNGCKYEFNMLPGSFLNNNNRCPKCARSKGEEKILSILTNKGINCIQEYKIPELNKTYNRNYSFDFYISDLDLIIEYDGAYHYAGIVPHQTKKNYDDQHMSDLNKDNFCKDNNILIIRIPFWYKDNLEKIIEGILVDNNREPIFIRDMAFDKIEYFEKILST